MKRALRHMKGNGVRFASCEQSERFIETARFLLHICEANASFLFSITRKPRAFLQNRLKSLREYVIIYPMNQKLRNKYDKLAGER